MRIAVIGAGGIGALYGACLARAGNDVTFVARGAHLSAMRANGLKIEGDRGEYLLHPVQATDDPASIGPVDVALFCVKLWDVESAGEQIKPLIGPDTAVITLQNGIDAADRLVTILGAGHVMAGVAIITGSITAPGVVRQFGTHNRIAFGELDGRMSDRGEAFGAACEAAGIGADFSAKIRHALWDKYTGLVAASSLCSAGRSSIGPLRADPAVFPLLEDAMQEVKAVAAACGIQLEQEVSDRWMALFRAVPDAWTPSMANDIMAKRRLEFPWLGGKLVELAEAHGVPAPINRALAAVLRPYANGG